MPRFTLEGSSTGAVKAVQDLQKAMDKVDASAQLTAKDMKKLEDAAARVVKNNEEPLAKYNRRMSDLAEQVKRGKLSLEDAEKAAMKYGLQLERAEKGGNKAFGPAALQQLTSFFGGFLTGAGSIRLVIDLLREMDTVANAAADRVQAAIGSSGESAQVSSDPAKFKEEVKNIRRRGIAVDRDQAQKLLFQLYSSGLDDKGKEELLGLGDKGLIATENIIPVATAARKLQRSFGLPSIEAVLDVSQQTSSNTSANLATTATALLNVSASAELQGIPFQDTAAALSVIEQNIKNIDESSTALDSLFTAAQKKGLKAKTVPGLVAEIDAKLAGGDTAIKVLGRKEAVLAFTKLRQNIDKFREERDQVATADERNVATLAADTLAADPEFQAALSRRRAEGSLAVREEEENAISENLLKTVRARLREKKGISGARGIEDKVFGFLDTAGFDDLLLRDALLSEQAGFRDVLSPAEEKQISDYLRRSAEALERMEQNSQAPQPSGRQEP